MSVLTRLTDSGFVISDANSVLAVDVGEYCDRQLLSAIPISAAAVSHGHGDHADASKLPEPKVPIYAPIDAHPHLANRGATMLHSLEAGVCSRAAEFDLLPYRVDHGPISAPITNLGLVILTPSGRRIWFAGDIAAETYPPPEGYFDLIVVPVGGRWVFDANAAHNYLAKFPGGFAALAVHYDYDPGQADAFMAVQTDRYSPVVLAPGDLLTIGRRQ